MVNIMGYTNDTKELTLKTSRIILWVHIFPNPHYVSLGEGGGGQEMDDDITFISCSFSTNKQYILSIFLSKAPILPPSFEPFGLIDHSKVSCIYLQEVTLNQFLIRIVFFYI